MSRWKLVRFADDERYAEAAGVIIDVAWNDLNFLNFTESHATLYESLMERHADKQVALVDCERDYVVATANCVPFHTDDPWSLPDGGWDWMLKTAHATVDRRPNVLGAIAISVSPAYRGMGLAREMIRGIGEVARELEVERLVVAVRPSAKWRYPHVDIADYAQWTDPSGRPFDPWLRSHMAMGARIDGIARDSMVVEQPVGFWEAWIGKRITESGPVLVPNGLVPVEIDLERNIGRYAEPNVWMSYPAIEAEARAAA